MPPRLAQEPSSDIGAIKKAVSREFGRAPAELSRRRGGDDKIVAIFLAREMTGLSGSEIGNEFGVTAAQVGNVVKSVRAGERQHLVRRIEKLRREVESASAQ